MRTVLVTGPGGAGRTTAAAATALAAAREGRRTLLLTRDRGPAPESVLGTALPRPATGGPGGAPWAGPAEVAPGLWAARIATGEHFEDRARELQDRGASLFDLLGATPLDPEELTELPGAEPLAVLAALRAAHAQEEHWDLLVVDLPPVHDTVRLLALPEQLRRYLRRLLPPERQAARALRPMLAQLAGVPMPAQRLYETAGRWEAELAAVQDVIEAAGTTVRLVAEPGPHAVEELRLARAALALQGCRVDALVANRLLPDHCAEAADPWTAGLAAEQRTARKELREEFLVDGVTVCELPHLGRAPRGRADLAELAGRARSTTIGDGAGYGVVAGRGLTDELDGWDTGAGGPEADAWTVEDRLAADGVLVWRLPLPGARRDALDLIRRGDELIVGVGPFRRVLPLPSALRRCTVSGAGLRDGALCVRFTPDPALWPRPS
ncbi:arsenic ABC transporter ATPase [Streptomyces eurocidicus]|uniref:Arsenic ABC transporter ATPase n=1 Tax=Streptomyces eurocidicus TaxID=66423 RepID=A0A2N8P1X1_STREU|nr:ArsA-related P-loop ATPase [Streptomyces eurocidicus]MBB5118580.1 arsenite-transporting ATPase [Streptomyces eurocidicus]MBF6052030.1 ArsA family ATPase [Streptomyces eurocidicus]PNE35016.1 arsenic ABC transporter ATPase [Streptomyces eurocidicus]